MQQRLHLLIVDGERRAALAARYGSRWLLPIVVCHERARAGPLIARWCAERALAADIAGQWLGRVEDDEMDWLIAILATAPAADAATPLEWIELDPLLNGASVSDYQTWALARCLRPGAAPAVEGPFGSLDWPAQARSWIAESMGQPWAWTPYRMSAHDVVLGVETARGRVYFKGLSRIRGSEAFVTRQLAALMPESFAATLALQQRHDGSVWWLTAECAGWPARDTRPVGAALARVQQRVMRSTRDWRELAPADLNGAALWACTGNGGARHADRIRDAVDYVQRDGVPRSWIPMDLDPSNVLVDSDCVRFIDVDDSFLGPAPLALPAFARRSRGASGYRDYEQAWSPPLGGIDWQRYAIAAAVFQTWRGWEAVKQHVERGEVYAALNRVEAGVHERLARALYGR